MRAIARIYLFCLSALIGVEIAIGAFLAPIIFFPEPYIGAGVLSHFQSGKLMTQVFLKFDVFLLTISAFAFIFESINLVRNKNEGFRTRFSAFCLALICLILAATFALYFTHYIVTAQSLGELATQTKAFLSVHSASELTMKIAIIAQSALFFLRIFKL